MSSSRPCRAVIFFSSTAQRSGTTQHQLPTQQSCNGLRKATWKCPPCSAPVCLDRKDFVLGSLDWSGVCASSFIKITTCKAEVYDVRCCQITECSHGDFRAFCLMGHLGAALDSVLHWDTPTGYRSKCRELHPPILGKCK